MRTLLALSFTVMAASFANADEATAKTLAGKWDVVSVTRDGKADESLKGAVREHDGAKYTIKPAAGSKAPEVTGAFVVNAKAKPVTIDMKPAGGRYKDKILKGIVKLEGDTLTIAFAEPEQPRPTSFDNSPGVVVAVHKKAK